MIHTITGEHCENCGRRNPETDEGYTCCCNEPVCYGDYVETWVVGTFEPYPSLGTHETGREEGCCAAAINADLAPTSCLHRV